MAIDINNWKEETWQDALGWAAWAAQPTIDKVHLLHLIDMAMEQYAPWLPHNIGVGGGSPLQGLHHSRRARIENPDRIGQVVAETLRFVRWVEAIGDCPEWYKDFLNHASTGRGANSPYEPYWWGMSKRPHSYWMHRIQFVRRRANQILAPYRWRVSNFAIREAVLFYQGGNRKAAFVAAAESLPASYNIYNYQDALKVLVSFKGWSGRPSQEYADYAPWRFFCRLVRGGTIKDFTTWRSFVSQVDWDGTAWNAPDFAVSKMGIRFVPYFVASDGDNWYIDRLKIMVCDGIHRPYHTRYEFFPCYLKYAFQQAREAWARQDEARRKELNVRRMFAAHWVRFSPVIVTPEHSYQAGNCEIGTARWMDQHGISGPVSARHLLNIAADDHRVLNVLAIAAGISG